MKLPEEVVDLVKEKDEGVCSTLISHLHDEAGMSSPVITAAADSTTSGVCVCVCE